MTQGGEPTYAGENMPRSATEHPEKSRGTNLLQAFEDSLPDFKNLDEEQHRKFVKAIRLLCRHFDRSEGRLRKDHFSKLRSTIARLSELYDKYHNTDAILASAILILNLHIESHYLDGQDANLVHNLTGLSMSPLDYAPDEPAALALCGASLLKDVIID